MRRVADGSHQVERAIHRPHSDFLQVLLFKSYDYHTKIQPFLCVWFSLHLYKSNLDYTFNKKPKATNIVPERNHLLKETPQILSSRSRGRRRESLRISFDILMASTSISATGFKGGLCCSLHGNWGNSIVGEDYNILAKSVPTHVRVGKPVRSNPMMKNVNEGKGLFAPIVVATRNIIGKKRFNQLRGKAIALHSQVQKLIFLLFLLPTSIYLSIEFSISYFYVFQFHVFKSMFQ